MYTNSTLVSFTKISQNRTANRTHAIDTITIHCTAGQSTIEALGNLFAQSSRQASSNYGVGKDGKIGMYVEEKDRSWCSSSAANDHRAVTIEVSSDASEPYAVNAKAYAAMLDLVTDICKRNGIKKLVWSDNKNERVNHLNGCNMTVHRDYAAKACPGTYLYSRMGQIAEDVNKRLGAANTTPTAAQVKAAIKKLSDGGVINTPDYWTANFNSLPYLPNLIINMANTNLRAAETNSFSSVPQAIKAMAEAKVINTPDYWLANFEKVQYLDTLILRFANRL